MQTLTRGTAAALREKLNGSYFVFFLLKTASITKFDHLKKTRQKNSTFWSTISIGHLKIVAFYFDEKFIKFGLIFQWVNLCNRRSQKSDSKGLLQ